MKQTKFAGFWIRLIAGLIDWLILIGIYVLKLLLFPNSGLLSKAELTINGDVATRSSSLLLSLLVIILLFATVQLLYFVIFTVNFGGTIGKLIFGIIVTDENNKLIGFGQAIKREVLGKIISSLVFMLGFLWIGFDKKKQGWHDKISKTYVIHKKTN